MKVTGVLLSVRLSTPRASNQQPILFLNLEGFNLLASQGVCDPSLPMGTQVRADVRTQWRTNGSPLFWADKVEVIK